MHRQAVASRREGHGGEKNPPMRRIQDPEFRQGLLAVNRSTHHRQAQGRQDQDRDSGKQAFLGEDLQASRQQDKDSACRQGASRQAKGPASSVPKRPAGGQLETDTRYQEGIQANDQKTEDRRLGSRQDPCRQGLAPDKASRPARPRTRHGPTTSAQCHRSSAATSLSFRACPPGCVSRRWPQKGLSGADGTGPFPAPKKLRDTSAEHLMHLS